MNNQVPACAEIAHRKTGLTRGYVRIEYVEPRNKYK